MRQTIERCAIDVFVDKGKGQRRGRGNAARQRLGGHRRKDDRRGDPGAVAIAARIFGAGILQDRGLHLNVKLLSYHFPHAMQPFAAARADLLVVGEVIFNALAWQVGRKWLAPAFFTFWLSRLRQSRVGKIGGDRLIDVVVSILGIVLEAGLLGFIEDTIEVHYGCHVDQSYQEWDASAFLFLHEIADRTAISPSAASRRIARLRAIGSVWNCG